MAAVTPDSPSPGELHGGQIVARKPDQWLAERFYIVASRLRLIQKTAALVNRVSEKE